MPETAIRFNPPTAFSESLGYNHFAAAVWYDRPNTQWRAAGLTLQLVPHHNNQTFIETFATRELAVDFAQDQLADHRSPFAYLVIGNQNNEIADVWFPAHKSEYYMLPVKDGNGWCHGFPGDAEYSFSGGNYDEILKGAKEVTIEEGYDTLIIQDSHGTELRSWKNPCLGTPVPFRDSSTPPYKTTVLEPTTETS